jgi:hypothetical protein
MAKGQDGGIVLRDWAGTCCCLVKNWQPLHHRTMSWVSARAVGPLKPDLKAFPTRFAEAVWLPHSPPCISCSS